MQWCLQIMFGLEDILVHLGAGLHRLHYMYITNLCNNNNLWDSKHVFDIQQNITFIIYWACQNIMLCIKDEHKVVIIILFITWISQYINWTYALVMNNFLWYANHTYLWNAICRCKDTEYNYSSGNYNSL